MQDFGRALVVHAPLRLLCLHAEFLDLALEALNGLDGVLLAHPAGVESRERLARRGEFALQLREPPPAPRVVLFAQRLALDLELSDSAVQLVDLLRHRVDLDAESGRGLVHEVDRLVGQESVADVAVGQAHGAHERGIRDPYAVVHLVALLEPAQDGQGLVHAGFADENRLEPPLQSRVLLDMQPVFVERRRAHHAKLAPSQGGLEHVPRVHRPLGRPGPHHGVEFVEEDDVTAAGFGDLLQRRLQALLELASVLGARQHRTDVQLHELLVPE